MARIPERKPDIEVKSTREVALEWWKGLSDVLKDKLYSSYFGCRSTDKFTDEIEYMYRKEKIQPLIDHFNKEKKQSKVNFKLLKTYIIDVVNGEIIGNSTQRENLELFFDMLSKSSSFAHKAHKELNKLDNNK